MKIHSKTDIGNMRSSNQDAFFAGELSKDVAFAVVCDGMGGATAGNIASSTAVKVISEYIMRSYRIGMDCFEAEKMLKNAIQSANIEVYDMTLKDTTLSGMGTTAVVVIILGKNAVIAHVGDSRAYLADRKLIQLTRDHSVVQTLIESGEITPEDAKIHPRKNVITRALGIEEEVVVDSTVVDLGQNYTILLCTDGLTNFVEQADILKTIKKKDDLVAEKLVELANLGGGGDNITVVTLSE